MVGIPKPIYLVVPIAKPEQPLLFRQPQVECGGNVILDLNILVTK